MASAFGSMLINQNLADLHRAEPLAFNGARKVVGVIIKDGFSLSALSGVTNTLRLANELCSSGIFHTQIIAHASSATSDVGLIVSPTMLMGDLDVNELDCLLVFGTDSAYCSTDNDLNFKLRQAACLGVLIGGLSSGCQTLLEAGLLDHRQCAANTRSIDSWQHTYKKVEFRPIPYLVDGLRMTCSSPYAVISMMVEFVGIQSSVEIAEAIGQGLSRSTYFPDDDASSISCFTSTESSDPAKE